MKAVDDLKKKITARLWEGARRVAWRLSFSQARALPGLSCPVAKTGSHHQSFPCTATVPWESLPVCFASSGSLRRRSTMDVLCSVRDKP